MAIEVVLIIVICVHRLKAFVVAEFAMKRMLMQMLQWLFTTCTLYAGIQGLNYPELPSRGILGNKETILFDCTCELCGYEWVWLLDELMSVCSVSDNFYTFF